MHNLLYLLIIGLLGMSACQKDIDSAEEFLIIGSSFGECFGNCAQLYLILDGQVYPDENIDYAGAAGTYYARNLFSTEPLANVDAMLLDSLISQLPKRLPVANLEDFGCPDCGDWGSLPLVVGKAYPQAGSYILDNSTSNMSADLKAYGRLIQQALTAWRG